MTDLDGTCFVKQGGRLIPADLHADEFLAKIPEGKEVIITIRRPRSPQHHRWFFAALSLVIENTDDKWPDVEVLLEDLKFATGHYQKRVNALTGEIYVVVKSISFAAMPQDAFQRFVKRCFDYLAPVLGISPEQLMEETEKTQRRTRSGSER